MKLTPYVLREMLDITQADFAALFGVHAMTVSKWERALLIPSDYQQQQMELLNAGWMRIPKEDHETWRQVIKRTPLRAFVGISAMGLI